eukprot:gene358-biopygen372
MRHSPVHDEQTGSHTDRSPSRQHIVIGASVGTDGCKKAVHDSPDPETVAPKAAASSPHRWWLGANRIAATFAVASPGRRDRSIARRCPSWTTVAGAADSALPTAAHWIGCCEKVSGAASAAKVADGMR